MNITYCECVYVCVCVCVRVALGIQHAMRMRHIVITACTALRYFPTLSHKRYDFRKTVTEHKICGKIFLQI
jgi:hypothetical protein